MMIVIKCRSNKTFAACVDKYTDSEWKLQECYYKAQGCLVEKQESATLERCNCEHCQSLEHKFDELIKDIKAKNY